MSKILMLMCLSLAALPAMGAGLDMSRQLGVGVELGEQNGGSVKYWLTRDQAIAGGLGITSSGDIGVHGEYVWTGWNLLPQPPRGDLGVHAAAGLRVRDDEFGIRTTAGLDYWLPGHPIETFVDLGPVFRLAPDRAVDFTGLIGVRFYFGVGGKG